MRGLRAAAFRLDPLGCVWTRRIGSHCTGALTLFLTVPSYVFPSFTPFLQPGGSAWRAVQLAARLPWFILTIEQAENDKTVWTDLLVSTGEEVCATLESPHVSKVVAVHFMQPPRRRHASWRCRRVRQVWRGTLEDIQQSVVFFGDAAGEFCEGVYGTTTELFANRRLVADFRVPTPSPRR